MLRLFKAIVSRAGILPRLLMVVWAVLARFAKEMGVGDDARHLGRPRMLVSPFLSSLVLSLYSEGPGANFSALMVKSPGLAAWTPSLRLETLLWLCSGT